LNETLELFLDRGLVYLCVGEGHYAVVKLARHVFTGEKVAVKVIDKQKLDQSTQTQMLQEVKLMKLVQHPNVVRLYEVSLAGFITDRNKILGPDFDVLFPSTGKFIKNTGEIV
jgi:serine/threonine protein kinase